MHQKCSRSRRVQILSPYDHSWLWTKINWKRLAGFRAQSKKPTTSINSYRPWLVQIAAGRRGLFLKTHQFERWNISTSHNTSIVSSPVLVRVFKFKMQYPNSMQQRDSEPPPMEHTRGVAVGLNIARSAESLWIFPSETLHKLSFWA